MNKAYGLKLAGLVLFASAISVSFALQASDTPHSKDNASVKYSPYAGNDFPMRPLFGDTHLHTSQSFDAIPFGTLIGPEEAYRFARGEEVTSSTGVAAKLSRPLDFLVVADHAESMGVLGEIKSGNPSLMDNERIKNWHDLLLKGGVDAMEVYYDFVAAVGGKGTPLPPELTNREMKSAAWKRNVDYAEAYNDPGRFTALIGYEWSSNAGGNNLHRVVIYRGGAELTRDTLPFSSLTSSNPEDLWQALITYEKNSGGQVLAIPHNGNLSNGTMFPLINPVSGAAITKEYAQIRNRLEPIHEVTQIKGDAETHPVLSPNDEFADYETWDKGNLDLSVDKTDDMLPYEYGRSALKLGLEVEEKLGVNPFKIGFIGSTDAHTGLAAVEEENFFGKLPHVEPNSHRATGIVAKFGDKAYMGAEMTASGYAAVWATENTREAIWDAMMRREVYATTGPRMTVRFFGGWDFNPQEGNIRHIATTGYARGVPMGGDLTAAPQGKAPTFLVSALKDVIGANIDRIQIVKGWLDEDGKSQERVYDVAVSDGRKINHNGRCDTPVGSTVNIENATWVNSIGESELSTVWIDPDFDPSTRAFYYVRVLEIPTPRWSTYDAARYGITLIEGTPLTTQERAYTSPIWYTPKS